MMVDDKIDANLLLDLIKQNTELQKIRTYNAYVFIKKDSCQLEYAPHTKPHRRLTDPRTLEILIMLGCNKDLWEAPEVNDVMKRIDPDELKPVTPVAPIEDATTPIIPSSLTSQMTRPLHRGF